MIRRIVRWLVGEEVVVCKPKPEPICFICGRPTRFEGVLICPDCEYRADNDAT